MDLSTLLGEYVDLLNRHNGPQSPEAKKFFNEHKDFKHFAELAKTAAQLWLHHHG